MFCSTEEELIIPDPTKGKKALAAMLRLKNKPRYGMGHVNTISSSLS